MKYISMEKKRFILITMVVLGGSILLIFLFNLPPDTHKKRRSDEKQSDVETSDLSNQAQQQQEKDDKEKEQIDVQDYREIYKTTKRRRSAWFYNKNNILDQEYCTDTNKGALVEFIFLERDREGNLRSYPYKRLWMTTTLAHEDCDQLVSNPRKPHTKLLIMVTTECGCGAAAGKTYKIRRLGSTEELHTDLHYTLQLPEREDLVFQKMFDDVSGIDDEKVYKIPILVNDVLKTKGRKKQKEKTFSFEVTGIPPAQKDGMKRVYRYRRNGKIAARGDVNSNDRVTFSLEGEEVSGVLGGNFTVYQKISPEYYKSHDLSRGDVWPIKLLAYKKDVQKRKVDLTGDWNFHHQNHEWITRDITLDRIFEDYPYDLPQETINDLKRNRAYLVATEEEQSESLPSSTTIGWGVLFGEDGKPKVTLSAPPGTYHMKISHMKVVKDMQWPPKSNEPEPNVDR